MWSSGWRKLCLAALCGASFLLLSLPAHAQFSETWEFYKALDDGDYREMMSRINRGANINRPKDGMPAIIMAADRSDQKLMTFLLQNGANIDGKTDDRRETALMRRSAVGNVETVRFLLARGAEPNAQDRNGETSLIKAARARKRNVVRILLDNGADPNRSDFTGKTAIDYARDARARNVVRLLEEAGASF